MQQSHQVDYSLSLLGSAPAQGESYLSHHSPSKCGDRGLLDQAANVEEGMQSLIAGMTKAELIERVDDERFGPFGELDTTDEI